MNRPIKVPDPYFFNALIIEGADKDGDGVISRSEAAEVLILDVSGCSILYMTGIEKFVNLRELRCNMNKLKNLDVSNNTALEVLEVSFNQLSSLDVTHNTSLIHLVCDVNQLTYLDITNNTSLEELNVWGNLLTALDISNNPDLSFL